MRLLIDVNVVLDVILARKPWGLEAGALLTAVEEGHAEGYVAGHTFPTMHYLIGREMGQQAANRAIADLLRILRVVPLDDEALREALGMGFRDFEDAVQVSAALKIGADFVVTRNADDFRGSPVPVRAPGELLVVLSEAKNG